MRFSQRVVVAKHKHVVSIPEPLNLPTMPGNSQLPPGPKAKAFSLQIWRQNKNIKSKCEITMSCDPCYVRCEVRDKGQL